jgi:regulator of cell morphogenesis and NO signaling
LLHSETSKMKKGDYKSMKIGEIVAQDFRSATVFKNAGIDFCCGGDQSLDQACNEKKLDITAIESSLRNLENSEVDNAHNFKEWNLDFLCDYIVNTHHLVVLKLIPELTFYTKKIADVHGAHHPELIEIAELFSKLSIELNQHLNKEEEVLFPAIKEALKTNSPESKEIIISEITRMKGEHEYAGGAMDKINVLSSNYKVPSDGCNTYQVAFNLLRQFEDDLHIHVHLENNILYSKALNL